MPVLEGLGMSITTSAMAAAVQRAFATASEIEAELNVANGRLGDGDTGLTVRRTLQKMTEVPADSNVAISDYLRGLSQAAAEATGSSLGTMFSLAMLALSRSTRGYEAIEWNRLGSLLGDVRESMMKRGGAQLGDKTVVDMVDAVSRALNGLHASDTVAEAAVAAAERTLDAFRPLPCRIGRARISRSAARG